MARMLRTLYLHAFAILMALLLSFGVLPQSEARDLTDVLVQGVSVPAMTADQSVLGTFTQSASGQFTLNPTAPQIAGRAVAPVLSGAISQAVTQEFPSASVSPAFTYRYNPTLSIFERSTSVPGPLFSERALTLGKGQLNFGVGYSFIDFSDFNGTDLHRTESPAFLLELFANGPLPGVALFPLSLSRLRTKIDLNAHVIVPALRYGITENWDVSLAVPIVDTFLRVRNETVRAADLNGYLGLTTQGQPVFVDPTLSKSFIVDATTISQLPFIKSQRRPVVLAKAAGSATGVGDITLRSKYHFWDSGAGGAALGLNLQLPSGEVRDFHGTDETHLSTFLYLSHVMMERFEPHLNLGVDFNVNDVDRSSFLYAVGASVLVWRQLGLIVDFIGRDEFARFPVRVPPQGILSGVGLNKAVDTCTTEQPCFLSSVPTFPGIPLKVKRNDIADFSFGLRYALGTSGSVFFGGIIPLNDDGLRADFIPSGGIEYTF